MKGSWNIVKQYAPWLGLLLCIDGFAALLLWLADVRAFRALTGVILLGACGSRVPCFQAGAGFSGISEYSG